MSTEKESQQKKSMPNSLKFLFGGAAGMSGTLFVQPLDLVKTRMQISNKAKSQKEYKSSLDCMRSVIKNEGFFGLYTGIGAALLRQASYTTVRLGIYTYLMEAYRARFGQNPTVGDSMAMAVLAGSCGAYVGTPAEVALIRMASDGRLPPQERRNYTNVVNALMRITKEEGVAVLWRGSLATVGRAIVVNVTQLASYSQFKHYFQKVHHMKEGIQLHFAASMVSGLLTTITSMPLDIAKTRLQSQKTVDGKGTYKNTVDVLFKVARHEGLFALWKGFTPYFCRLGPHTVLTMVFLEQFTRLYYKYVLGIENKGSGL